MKLIVFQIEEVWVKAMGENTFGMTKGLPYGIFMKRTIQDIIGNGELQRIKMKWKTKSLDCKSATSTGGKPLSFEKSISLFILIFVGTILALVLFILEIIFKNYKSNNLMKPAKIEERGIPIKKLMLHLVELQNVHHQKYISNSKMKSIIQGLELLGDK